MHKLLSTLIFLPFFVETGGSSLELGVDAGWEEESEVSGEKRVDF